MGLSNKELGNDEFNMDEYYDDFEKENNDSNGKSELELEREKNIREMHQFVFGDDPEGLEEALSCLENYKKATVSNTTTSLLQTKKKKRHKDKAVVFNCQIPLERRKSLRLANIEPLHYDKLDFESEKYVDGIESLEKVVFKPKIKINSSRRHSAPIYIAVEDVTTDYLSKIAKSSTKKIYNQNGSSCHQCRQKTLDSKTVCRSGRCFGVRGQFCGPCLRNRYGEDAAVALLDSKWECPGCRGRCNCSFCRKREGKRPTGILAPIAQRQGYKSVDDFLQSLNGAGDFDDEVQDDFQESEEDLLGFDLKGNPVLRGPLEQIEDDSGTEDDKRKDINNLSNESEDENEIDF